MSRCAVRSILCLWSRHRHAARTPPALSAAALLAVASLGCSSTHMVTPWLRATSSTSYAHGIIAESGGGGPRTTGRLERLEGGAWVPVEGWTMMTAFAFAGDTRAVVGRLLVPQTGTPKQIDCTDELRAMPNDAELICVGTYQPRPPELPTDLVRIKRFDRDANLLGERVVDPPVRPPGGSSLYDSVSTRFLGFAPDDGLFFSVYRDTAGKPHGPDALDGCDAFKLGADDHWRPAGRLPFVGRNFGACGDLDAWKTKAGVPVVAGTRARSW